MSSKVFNGKCLCGSVEFTAEISEQHIGACHCSMCRRWGGGPYISVDCGDKIKFTGEENISAFSSSDWAERGFCQQCGTHLFYRLKQNNQHIVPAGVFEGDINFEFDHQIFIDEKPGYYEFANNTKTMTGAEVFAQFAPPENA